MLLTKFLYSFDIRVHLFVEIMIAGEILPFLQVKTFNLFTVRFFLPEGLLFSLVEIEFVGLFRVFIEGEVALGEFFVHVVLVDREYLRKFLHCC